MIARICLQNTRRSFVAQQKRLVSSTPIRFNSTNAQEIEKLNLLIKKKLIELEEEEKRKSLEDLKPKLSDFKRPILLTLVIGSTAYLTLHLLWWNLEYSERETDLKLQLRKKEEELQKLLEQTGQSGKGDMTQRKSFWSKLRPW